MRTAVWLLVALSVGALVALWAVAPASAAEAEKGKSKKLGLADVPAPVRETILKEAGDNKVKEIEEKKENGQVVYEAEWKVNGKEVEIKVAADGKLLEKEMEIALDDAPAPVKATILKEAGSNKVTEVARIVADGRECYEAEWKADGKEIEIQVAPDGTLIKKQVEADDDDDDDDDDDEM